MHKERKRKQFSPDGINNLEISVRPMRYRACNQAHNAEVEIWVIFATRNSLKLHMMQKAVFHHEQRSCHNAKVVLANDGSSKRQAPIDQSPRHRPPSAVSLKAFGRRPRCKPHRRDRPASEALNRR
jgi:hypothetical protein